MDYYELSNGITVDPLDPSISQSFPKYSVAETVTYGFMFSIMFYGNIPDNKYPDWMRFVFFSYDPMYPSSHNVTTCSHSSLTHNAESPSLVTYHSISVSYPETLDHKIAFARINLQEGATEIAAQCY